jgi:hypothetical protein
VLAVGLTVLTGVVTAVMRLLPFSVVPPNLKPLGAMSLFGGARLGAWLALLLPLALMGVTDFILWASLGWQPYNPFVYAAVVGYVLLGRLLLRKTTPVRIVSACVLGSAQFFLLTNLSVWIDRSGGPNAPPEGQAYVWVNDGSFDRPVVSYARNVEGLLACYALALPFNNPDAPPLGFFGNTLLVDLFGTTVLLAVHAWLARRALRPAPVHSRST